MAGNLLGDWYDIKEISIRSNVYKLISLPSCRSFTESRSTNDVKVRYITNGVY